MSSSSPNATRPRPHKKNNHSEDEGEERCYYFSPLTLRNERELLMRYKAEGFLELLMRAYDPLYGIIEVMKNIKMEVPVNSTILFGLGQMLEHVAGLIFAIQDAYSTVELLEE